MAPSKKRKKGGLWIRKGTFSTPKKACGCPRRNTATQVELASQPKLILKIPRPTSSSGTGTTSDSEVLPASTIEGIASEFLSPVDKPNVQAATALLTLNRSGDAEMDQEISDGEYRWEEEEVEDEDKEQEEEEEYEEKE
ncbi:hypothetical protein DFH08DRAFT_953201 [Mycena albidolilacea]|uniref:Uncharacterized protein n=1 Tax=Mycena albidolilacea TaxID=1033008 RepID=A0AAD7AG82_9AGAR|nr:hypothetical protein DFH08DRAFT_953201 [Mycena albidolilacea]